MGKNKDMLKIFIKVLTNDKTYQSLVTPNASLKSIYTIPYEALRKKGYKNLIFDIDNTIMPVNDLVVPPKLKELFKGLQMHFKICLLSNNELERVEPVAKELNTLFLSKANKPKKEAFQKSIALLKGTNKNTIMIGDQMLTDIVGGNRYGLYTILVEPYKKRYDLKTGFNRLLQIIMIKKLKKKNKMFF